MKRIAVVGGAGFIGRALCAALGPGAFAVDVRTEDPRHSIDIAATGARERLARAFAGADVVVHLAARVDPVTPAERAAARRLHVDGTRAVVRAMHDAGVRRLVLASSAVVYGASPNNPVPLDESAPLAPHPSFPYAVDKHAQEQVVAAEADAISVAVARPAIVYGGGARNYLTEILRRAPFLPALDGCRPPLQFVHVDDVAAAFAVLAGSDVTGAFNIAPVDWLSFDDVARRAGLRTIVVPRALVAPALDALARVLPPHLRAPSSMLPYLMHPFALSSARLQQLTGWRPRYNSEQALRTVLG